MHEVHFGHIAGTKEGVSMLCNEWEPRAARVAGWAGGGGGAGRAVVVGGIVGAE